MKLALQTINDHYRSRGAESPLALTVNCLDPRSTAREISIAKSFLAIPLFLVSLARDATCVKEGKRIGDEESRDKKKSKNPFAIVRGAISPSLSKETAHAKINFTPATVFINEKDI